MEGSTLDLDSLIMDQLAGREGEEVYGRSRMKDCPWLNIC